MNLLAVMPSRALASRVGRCSYSRLSHPRISLPASTRESNLAHGPQFKQQSPRHIDEVTRRRSTASAVDDEQNHSQTVRKLMRHVPHPVVIVTAAPKRTAEDRSDASHWRGATISSFVTVALDPHPVVCFNIKHDSSTFATLKDSAQFNVHLLRSGAEAQAIATKFASGNALEPFHDGEGELEWWVREPVAQEGSAPVIEGSKDEVEAEGTAKDSVVSFRLSCAHMADKTVAIGDHVVVFGRVVGLSHGLDLEQTGSTSHVPCLLYVEGGYSRTASQ